MVKGLSRKLAVEHANWLVDQDQAAGVTVRPRSYYENVGKLWAVDKLKRAQLPVSISMGNWTPTHRDFVVTADGLLSETAMVRQRFSRALGTGVDMSGWSPWKAVKSAVKSVEHGVEKGASLAYQGVKFGVTKPFVYTYKGIKYVGEKAMQLAMQPIKLVVGRFKKKMVNRKAAELAQQRGLSSPGPSEKAEAATWAKSVTQKSGSRFARAAASLMGRGMEYGNQSVDISLGEEDNDLMGIAPLALYPLIALGAVGLAVILDKIYEAAFKHSSAPAQDPNAQSSYDSNTADPSATDPGAASTTAPDSSAPGGGNPGAGDPGTGDPNDGSYDSSYDSSGYARSTARPTVTIEQLNRLPPAKRLRAQQLIRSGHIRLA